MVSFSKQVLTFYSQRLQVLFSCESTSAIPSSDTTPLPAPAQPSSSSSVEQEPQPSLPEALFIQEEASSSAVAASFLSPFSLRDLLILEQAHAAPPAREWGAASGEGQDEGADVVPETIQVRIESEDLIMNMPFSCLVGRPHRLSYLFFSFQILRQGLCCSRERPFFGQEHF
jgi:hypothetical protein